MRSFDFVIFDLPPINAVSDGLVVANLIQGMLVVVRQDYSNRQDLSATLRQLEYLHIKVLGFVMTCATASGGRYGRYARYSRYKYGYGYGEEAQAAPGPSPKSDKPHMRK